MKLLDLFRAEWLKLSGNRWVSGLLIWIFPIGALAVTILMLIVGLLVPEFRANMARSSFNWSEDTINSLGLLTNALGRVFFVSFAVVAFAGEYQWQTWKNVVPRRHRPVLLLVKFATVAAFILTALLTLSLIWGLGRTLLAAAFGAELGPALTGATLRAFAGDYLFRALLVFLTVLISAGQAALLAMIMRSILGGVLVSIAIAIAEPITFLGLTVAAGWLGKPQLLWLTRLTPLYNFDNINAWITLNEPSGFTQMARALYPEYAFTDPLSFSVVIIALWAIGLPALMTWLFNRQDLSS